MLTRRGFLKRGAAAAAGLSGALGLGGATPWPASRAWIGASAPPGPGGGEDARPASGARDREGRAAGVDLTLALAGDTMLGRGVAEALSRVSPRDLFSSEVLAFAREADLFVLNLECCVSTRGAPWPAPGKPFFFRAPPAAVEALAHLGVDCVSLANNHALDFGYEALLDTFEHLRAGGIRWAGAGADVAAARAPATLRHGAATLAVVAVTDHPRDFAATADRPGVAYADLQRGVPDWLLDTLARAGAEGDRPERPVVLLTPHWGPNMRPEPVPHVRAAAAELAPRATLVAGHSAHVFQGVEGNVVYDLGDFLDDYATDAVLRNDLGLLFLVRFRAGAPRRLEALPLKLEYCYTRGARGPEAAWIRRRFSAACRAMGTEVREEDGRLVIEWAGAGP